MEPAKFYTEAARITTTEPAMSKTLTLLSLPAELRNIIWAFALGGKTFDIKCEIRIPWGTVTKNVTTQCNSLSLLRTCRQIYWEARLFPFRFNSFQFKSEDAFRPWLDRFEKAQQAAIAEIHLVTWKAKHMVESRGFAPRKLNDVFPFDRLEGLQRLRVEVRYTGVVRDCDKWLCPGSELEDSDFTEQEGRLRLRWTRHNPRLEIVFERVAV